MYEHNLFFSEMYVVLLLLLFVLFFCCCFSRLPVVLLLISRQLGESDFVFYSLFIDSIPLFARDF